MYFDQTFLSIPNFRSSNYNLIMFLSTLFHRRCVLKFFSNKISRVYFRQSQEFKTQAIEWKYNFYHWNILTVDVAWLKSFLYPCSFIRQTKLGLSSLTRFSLLHWHGVLHENSTYFDAQPFIDYAAISKNFRNIFKVA